MWPEVRSLFFASCYQTSAHCGFLWESNGDEEGPLSVLKLRDVHQGSSCFGKPRTIVREER